MIHFPPALFLTRVINTQASQLNLTQCLDLVLAEARSTGRTASYAP